jgi:mono/diheme cytochrome c family protein
MQKLILMVVTILNGAALAFGAADSKDAESKALDVIKKKCIGCHGEDRINAAFKSGRDMKAVQREMEKKGAKLNDQDKSTLDFYWKQTPLLKK